MPKSGLTKYPSIKRLWMRNGPSSTGKLEAIVETGAKVVLSKLPIGDLATQYFADRDIFCAGRVTADDLKRVVQAVGGSIQSTCSAIEPQHLGTCGRFEEKQMGGERFNLFEDCPQAKTCTLILRGGAEQFIAEVERSLHDSIMIVKRAIQNNQVVAGGGACEVRLALLPAEFRLRSSHDQPVDLDADGNLQVPPRPLSDYHGQTTAHRWGSCQSTRSHSSSDLRQCRSRRHRHTQQAPYATRSRRPLGRSRCGLGRRAGQHEAIRLGACPGQDECAVECSGRRLLDFECG